MPIPPEHLERLESELSEHESWLRTLRRQIEALEGEAAVHEMIVRLGRDPDLLRVLDELHDRPELAKQMAKDPRAFLENRGIEVPADATVTTDPKRSAVEARFNNPPVEYGVGWSRPDGFYLIAAPERAEPPEPPPDPAEPRDAPTRKQG